MPHVIVKLWTGKSETQKQELTDAIVHAVTHVLEYRDDAVSVGFEEVAPSDWQTHVVEPDIRDRWNTLTKQPGYAVEPRDQARKPS